jgi:hypothetical protein
MQWEFILALVITIPIILFPVALIWYFNIGGIYEAVKRARSRQAQMRERENVRIETK